MDIIPQDEKVRLIALGSEGMMREIAEGKHCQPTSPYRDAIDALLASVKATEEATSAARRESRDDEAIAIARTSNAIAREANTIARSASFAATAAAASASEANTISRSNSRRIWRSEIIAASAAIAAIVAAIAAIFK